MAPRENEVEADHGDEKAQFLKDVAEYHEKRGTFFDPNPKVGPRHIDLFELYRRVNDEGGYDKVSDTRGNKLAWRRIASDFLPPGPHIVQLAFLVKTVYYKYLSAYEITNVHKREPPPREILEDLTAKGGDLLNRTLENYGRRVQPEVEKLINGANSDDSDDDNGTPRGDKMDLDDTPGTGGRVTRGLAGLRQAPPQRVLYGQMTESKTRSGGSNHSPTPGGTNGFFGTSAAAATIANYEPRSVAPSIVKAVPTPSNNPAFFKDLTSRHKKSLRRNKGLESSRGAMLPGTGFTGPNIYMRCLRALESSIPDEVSYALHHLVKISFERGDKFLFSQFTNLADELMRKVCNVSTVWYNHPGWNFTWSFGESEDARLLFELSGTSNLIEKIQSHQEVDVNSIHTEHFDQVMSTAYQACLVLRNMIVLDDNAKYLSEMPLVRDMMTIIFQLPKRAETVELKYYALEIAELLTKYWVLEGNDPLYLSLLEIVEDNSADRGIIILGLRAISRISLTKDEIVNKLENVPTAILVHISNWLLVEDEELRAACLDFLYQYTAVTENVAHIVKIMDTEGLVDTVMNFLMLGAIRIALNPETPQSQDEQQAVVSQDPAENLPKLSSSVVQALCQSTDPKEQSSSWLRTCFVQDPQGEITQLELWSAYNEAFSKAPSDNQLMVAKDFITNVTAVFPSALARVVPHESDRSRSKYTMKGISPRAVPIDLRGRALVRCQWRTSIRPSTEGDMVSYGLLHKDCDQWFPPSDAEEMWTHIVESHLEIPRDPDNPRKFNDRLVRDTGRKFSCSWTGCNRYPAPGVEDPYKLCMHVKIHLPESGPRASMRAKYTKDTKRQTSPSKLETHYMNTPVDEKGQPIGIPLSALLVLRNLARQMLKIDAKDMRGRQNLIERHFALHMERICHVMTHNYSLRHYTPEFIQYVSKGIGLAHKLPRAANGITE